MNRNIPILITGCQRSGTTLLSLILDSHPEISGIDEMDFNADLLHAYLDHPDYHPYVAFKLPVASHNAQSFKNVKNMKILWCIRDPLDVVASMVKLHLDYLNEPIPWSAHPFGAETEIKNAASVLNNRLRSETKKQLQVYEEILGKQPQQRNYHDQVFTGSLCWNLKQEMLGLYDDLKIEYQIVKFEKLVATPKEYISELVSFLGIEWNDNLLNHHSLHSGVSVGNTVNSKPIDAGSVGKGRKTLDAQHVKIVRDICFEYASKFGYEL